eukprot:1158880-Pelagomonas_calceolata.AAC.3
MKFFAARLESTTGWMRVMVAARTMSFDLEISASTCKRSSGTVTMPEFGSMAVAVQEEGND